jgi:hypothetical protein
MNAKQAEELKGKQLFQIGENVYEGSISELSPSKEYVCVDITSGPTPCQNWFKTGRVDVAEVLTPPAAEPGAATATSDVHKTHSAHKSK